VSDPIDDELQRMAEGEPRVQRLSVNISPDTVAQLRHVLDRDDVSLTETVRRLIGYGALIDAAIRDNGEQVVIRGRHGFRVVALLDSDGRHL
jgi:hypothetical protein